MATKRDIIQTSIALIDHGGYRKLTIRTLSQQLSISSLSLYHYFSSKDALLWACERELTQKLNNKIQAVATGPAKEQLVNSVKVLLDEIKQHPAIMDFIYFKREDDLPAAAFTSFHQTSYC